MVHLISSPFDGGGLRWPPAQRASGSERGGHWGLPSPSPLPPGEREIQTTVSVSIRDPFLGFEGNPPAMGYYVIIQVEKAK